MLRRIPLNENQNGWTGLLFKIYKQIFDFGDILF